MSKNNTFFGKKLQVRIFEVEKCDDEPNELNDFLAEQGGHIVDIQTNGMMYGYVKFIVIYEAE